MPDKILVIQTAFPGDAILTLPMLQQLKKQNPDSYIGVVAIPATSDIFAASPAVDEVYVLDKRNTHRKMSSVRRFALQLKEAGYNKIITPHRSLRTALLVYFSRIKDSTGFSNSALPFAFRKVVKYEKNAHEVERNLKLIGFEEDWRLKPEIITPDPELAIIDKIKNNLSGKMVGIAPGSVWETKKYPEKYFARLLQMLSERNYTPVLVGGGNDRELCERIIELSGTQAKNVAGELSIPGTVGFLKECEFIISNDSAPTHMGVAAGIKVVTIYCSTVPAFGFYPYGENDISIGLEDLRCKPCGIHGYKNCPESHYDCGLLLNPETVIDKIFS